MEAIAIIEGVCFGCSQTKKASLSFTLNTIIHGAAVHVLNSDETLKFIEMYELDDIRELEGRHCIVEVDADTIKFNRLCNK